MSVAKRRLLCIMLAWKAFFRIRAFHVAPSLTQPARLVAVGRISRPINHQSIRLQQSRLFTSTNNNPFILEGLNPSQVEAVTQPLSSITRVVAGPGSGKTRILTARMAHLLQTDPRSRILGVTFTRKAAGEMQLRLEKLLTEQSTRDGDANASRAGDDEIVQEGEGGAYAKGIHRVSLGTFHSICAKILRWNGDRLASLSSVQRDMVGSLNATVLDNSFAILDEGEQLRILKTCLDELNIDLSRLGMKPRPILSAIGEVKALYAQGKDPFRGKNSERDKKPAMTSLKVAAKVFSRYRQELLAANCLDFDDLILLTRELLLEHDDVRENLHRRWTHVLVDEFQDTSRTQLDLVKLLTSTSLFVVGDADQSIYSWRGAHVGSLSDFEHEFRDCLGGVQTVYLMENYRSTSNIVRAAQKVISHKAGASGADKLRQDMKPKRGSGPPPRVLALADDQKEAEFVVKTVAEGMTAGKYNQDHSVAVLYRTNAQSRALEEACVKNNLPYVIFGASTSFYKRQEIKDCLCFLRWLHNGRDRASMVRAMTTPRRGIGESAIAEFGQYCALVEGLYTSRLPGQPLPTPLDILISLSDNGRDLAIHANAPPPSDTLSTRPLRLLTEFSRQMRSLRKLALTQTLEIVLASVVNSMALMDHLDKISKSKTEFLERKANVEELQQASRRYSKYGPCLRTRIDTEENDEEALESPLGSFLDDVALVTDMSERSAGERFVVNLMTIHASKGMEFDTVFVVGNEDGTFPTSQAIQEGESSVQLEEEKRLCYVAMTRAKTELLLTWRKEVSVFTSEGIRTVRRGRSRFLDILATSAKSKKESKPLTADTTAVFRRTSDNGQSNGHPAPESTRRDYTTGNGYMQRKAVFTNGPKNNYSSRLKQPAPSSAAKVDPYRKTPSEHRRPSSLQRPWSGTVSSPSVSTPPRPTRPVDSGRRAQHNGTTPRTNGETRRSASAKPTKKNRTMDSTWFFPVGSQVVHKNLGKGTVQEPPPTASQELLVRVLFENGRTLEFPAHGSDITPAIF